ncbi:MAG: hypothetical protein ACXWCS_14300 [Burkholderiales bacterium]
MNWEELERVLRAKRHTDELSALRSEVSREGEGLKGTRRDILQQSTQMELADLVSKYMSGESVQGATQRHVLAKRVAAVLLQDVKRGTDRQLQAIVVSADRLTDDRVARGMGRPDVAGALARLDSLLRVEGGVVRIVADRDSVTAIYREIGATGSNLAVAIADLVGKLERLEKRGVK